MILVASEERLKLAIETANLAVRDSNVTTGAVFVGEPYASLFEYDKELFRSGEFQLSYFVHEEDKDYVRALIQDQLDG